MVVFFDGVCHLCQASVRFLIARDPKARLKFASLQSPSAQELIGRAPGEAVTSIVLWQDGRIYRESTAALRIARQLRFPWFLAYVFILVPRPLRDWVYRFIASNRYAWFGRDDACWMPTPELKARFLETKTEPIT